MEDDFTDWLIDREECVEELSEEEILEKENEELRKKVKELEKGIKRLKRKNEKLFEKSVEETVAATIKRLKEFYIHKQKIKNKIKEYLDYDKKHKTYTKDGRENFTMEYFKAKALQKLLQESEDK